MKIDDHDNLRWWQGREIKLINHRREGEIILNKIKAFFKGFVTGNVKNDSQWTREFNKTTKSCFSSSNRPHFESTRHRWLSFVYCCCGYRSGCYIAMPVKENEVNAAIESREMYVKIFDITFESCGEWEMNEKKAPRLVVHSLFPLLNSDITWECLKKFIIFRSQRNQHNPIQSSRSRLMIKFFWVHFIARKNVYFFLILETWDHFTFTLFNILFHASFSPYIISTTKKSHKGDEEMEKWDEKVWIFLLHASWFVLCAILLTVQKSKAFFIFLELSNWLITDTHTNKTNDMSIFSISYESKREKFNIFMISPDSYHKTVQFSYCKFE